MVFNKKELRMKLTILCLSGPSVLEIINSLLTHLRGSVSRERGSGGEERQYQDALINALGEFAAHLPDYQKIEIMMFIMSKVPSFTEGHRKGDALLQQMLLKSLLTVSFLGMRL